MGNDDMYHGCFGYQLPPVAKIMSSSLLIRLLTTPYWKQIIFALSIISHPPCLLRGSKHSGGWSTSLNILLLSDIQGGSSSTVSTSFARSLQERRHIKLSSYCRFGAPIVSPWRVVIYRCICYITDAIQYDTMRYTCDYVSMERVQQLHHNINVFFLFVYVYHMSNKRTLEYIISYLYYFQKGLFEGWRFKFCNELYSFNIVFELGFIVFFL